MTLVLEAEKLSVERSGKRVLHDITFDVRAGEVFALLGGNGAGKSTTLLTLLGFLAPSEGAVRVNGRAVQDDITAARAAIAYLPEAAALYGHLTARENLRYFLSLAGAPSNAAAIEGALGNVSLDPSARASRLGEYSKGMRQKVAIALALLRGAPILLLDEPTSGLDPVAIDEFHALARRLAGEGKSILMVTHDVYGACQVADRIALLRKGELVGRFAAPEGGRIETGVVHASFVGRGGA
jgi:ABC-2 type transport system ATP-binding protein